MRPTRLVAAVAVVAAGALAAPAHGATTVGQTANASSTGGCGAPTAFEAAQIGVTSGRSYVVPADGVLTSWATYPHGSLNTGDYWLRVYRPNAARDGMQVIASSGPQAFRRATLNVLPLRASVRAGDVLGVFHPLAGIGVSSACAFGTEQQAEPMLYGQAFDGPAPIGATAPVAALLDPQRLNVSAELEADADGDGHGDETQDACPGDAARQSAPCVRYALSAFGPPLDAEQLNVATAGQAVPVKWRVVDLAGAPVLAAGHFAGVTSVQGAGACAGLPEDAVEPAAGGSGLQSLGDGWWQYSWKTPKAYAGQCRTMKLSLDDGQTRSATFRFR